MLTKLPAGVSNLHSAYRLSMLKTLRCCTNVASSLVGPRFPGGASMAKQAQYSNTLAGGRPLANVARRPRSLRA